MLQSKLYWIKATALSARKERHIDFGRQVGALALAETSFDAINTYHRDHGFPLLAKLAIAVLQKAPKRQRYSPKDREPLIEKSAVSFRHNEQLEKEKLHQR